MSYYSSVTSGLIVYLCPGLRSLPIEVDCLSLWAFAHHDLKPWMQQGLCHRIELYILIHLESLRHIKLILEMPEPNVSRARIERLVDDLKEQVKEGFRNVGKSDIVRVEGDWMTR